MKTEKTACILCSRNCGLTVEIEDGQFKKIRGDDDHPVSKGYICQKAARLTHYQTHDDRLQFPLQRQPDGSFKRVSWDAALDDIAARLIAIRDQHGGYAYASVGGGGQGNHLAGAYSGQLRSVMKSRYIYSALAQEKTGDFWLNGRFFGNQTCHTTEDVEHSDYVLFIGANPFQAHGIPNARDTLREIRKDPARTMVVIDPRRSETAKVADIHLQLKPGTDAFLMSAMLAIIIREGLHDRNFLAQHCSGFEAVEQALLAIPVAEYAQRSDVPLADIERVARGFATADSACIRIDLGIQHTLHTTLNGYLEKLLYLVTGNFGRRGCNNLHTFLMPILGDTDERKGKYTRTRYHKMFPISGLFPPNILPDEIMQPGEDRIRAVFVDSANPVVSYPDTAAYERAFAQLELLVVVDVAMTETARLAHYVLPAASQFEKWEATGFNLEFPENAFHLRHPLFAPMGEALPEPEIYTRLLEKMGAMPRQFPVLSRIARHEPAFSEHWGYMTALGSALSRKKAWQVVAPSILYRTLGPTLVSSAKSENGMAVDASATALLLPLAIQYAQKHERAMRRAGYSGHKLKLGPALFKAILDKREGVVMSRHEYDEVWSLVAYADKRIQLAIPEMLVELQALATSVAPGGEFPFVLMAGERRSYNANQIYRDPAWRKIDPHGAMRMHPLDAGELSLADGAAAVCESDTGRIPVVIEHDDAVRRGTVTLPHGYGMRYRDSAPVGPELNRLTSSDHCEPLTRTPYHKYVPVRVLAQIPLVEAPLVEAGLAQPA